MSDDNHWTESQQAEIQKWLEWKWPNAKQCNVCGQTEMFVGASPAHLVVGGPSGGMRIGESYPVVVLLCRNCGNVKLMSAMIANIKFPSAETGATNG